MHNSFNLCGTLLNIMCFRTARVTKMYFRTSSSFLFSFALILCAHVYLFMLLSEITLALFCCLLGIGWLLTKQLDAQPFPLAILLGHV